MEKRLDANQLFIYIYISGAIVGGPNKDDIFYDERNDWSQTEVALDYNAPFQGLIAYQITANAADPPYVTITEPRPYVTRSHGMEKWLIAVIVIVILFVLAGLGYFAWLKRKALKQRLGGNKEYAVPA